MSFSEHVPITASALHLTCFVVSPATQVYLLDGMFAIRFVSNDIEKIFQEIRQIIRIVASVSLLLSIKTVDCVTSWLTRT